MGENVGQNTKAGTMDQMVEQGMKIYKAIYKRVWRAMKKEISKLYNLNSRYLPLETAFGTDGAKILREDYNGDAKRIVPTADPYATSDHDRVAQATLVKQASMSTNGYDLQAVEKNFLRANRVDGWESMYLGPDKVPPLPNHKVQVEQMKLEAKKQHLELDKMKFIMKLQEDHSVNQAKILQMEAMAAKLLEEAGGVKTGHDIAAFEAAIGAMKSHNEMLLGHAQTLLKGMEIDNARDQQTSGSNN